MWISGNPAAIEPDGSLDRKLCAPVFQQVCYCAKILLNRSAFQIVPTAMLQFDQVSGASADHPARNNAEISHPGRDLRQAALVPE
jgi:hypothetical protein